MGGGFLLRKEPPRAETAEDGLPMPPDSLWEGYGPTQTAYIKTGQRDVARMRTILSASGITLSPGSRLLDFGCAAGRMLRCFSGQPLEAWGVDIDANHIAWCEQYLSPPFRFATTTTLPHLPFEDRYFDLAYAGSVFTHIAELADAWLLELKRVLRPGGALYATIHDQSTVDFFLTYTGEYPHPHLLRERILDLERKEGLRVADLSMYVFGRTLEAQVFYDLGHLCRKWGLHMDVLSASPHAYGYQTALLLRRPA
jgi:SAM-dependent methyltransferase